MPLNPISIASEILFAHLRPESLWGAEFRAAAVDPRNSGLKMLFLQAAHHHPKLSYQNEEEKAHVYALALDQIARPLHSSAKLPEPNGIFKLLLHAVKEQLIDDPVQPLVKYNHVLGWRRLSSEIGQDLPVCAYLAWQDVITQRERYNFTWPLHLKSNHQALRQLLQAGMAENHYHLWGSVPSFHLLWISLMHSLHGHEDLLAAPNAERLDGDRGAIEGLSNVKLSELSKFAALLRLYLFLEMEQDDALWQSSKEEIKPVIEAFLKGNHTKSKLDACNGIIAVAQQRLGLAFEDGVIPDYAIFKNLNASNFNDAILLSGERMFLYRVFKRLARSDWDECLSQYFYVYLLIKAKVRREFVQLNERVGFHNFKIFQDRKDSFEKGNPQPAFGEFLHKWATRFAISLPLKEMPILSLEARIGPKGSAIAFQESVSKTVTDANLKLEEIFPQINLQEQLPSYQVQLPSSPEKDKFYFVVHFIKKADKVGKGHRNQAHRVDLQDQARALRQFRDQAPQWAQYIKGIDAANAEIGCRPEVFAHIFRFLRIQEPLRKMVPVSDQQVSLSPLRVTYHVGEDFLDIVDGLRAIDEAIRFLEYRRGDRLGHALALGVEAREWYKAKQGTVLLPLQDLIDNLAWMYMRLTEIGDPSFLALQNKIKIDWKRYYKELAAEAKLDSKIESITIEDYYWSWELRGDDPARYEDPHKEPLNQGTDGAITDPMAFAGLRQQTVYGDGMEIELEQIRKNPAIRKLYHTYHYNVNWKKGGGRIVRYDISASYIQAASKLQAWFQNRLKGLGIGIEANPTSNYLIGTFRRYDLHPIRNLYNLGLTADPDELSKCPQMSVSINTDDLGIFDTSLENEYVLMAAALEKMQDENGQPVYNQAMILDWLDRIRKNGLGQSFMEIKQVR